ncbi:hypothetical protein DV737_g259, partial [Chaetothyriales sp. CBS 132003]
MASTPSPRRTPYTAPRLERKSAAAVQSGDSEEDASNERAHVPQPVEKEQLDDAWKAIMADDDDEFLVDDPDDLLPESDSETGSSSASFDAMLRESPPDQATSHVTTPPADRSAFPQRKSSVNANAYAPQQLSPPHRNLGLSRPGLPPIYSFQAHLQQQPTATSAAAESFVDQSKGGYKSPYDLPTDLSKPRKRVHVPQPIQTSKPVAPPPRRDTISEKQLQSPFAPDAPAPPQQPTPAPSAQAAPAALALVQPDRLDPFSNAPLQPPLAPPVPTAPSTRYSPAPPATIGLPRTGPSPRYSPAPPPQAAAGPAPNRYASQPHVPQAPAAPPHPAATARHAAQQPAAYAPPASQLPYAPRTSSPLAHHKASADDASVQLPTVDHGQQSNVPPISRPPISHPQTTSPPPPAQPYAPPPTRPVAAAAAAPPPRRSQTQSPGTQWHRPALQMSPPSNTSSSNRPASAHSHLPRLPAYAQPEAVPLARPNVQARGVAPELDFIQPNDESAADLLQRWKGAPIIHFGFGGTLVTSFPKQIPRYGQGTLRPQIKPTAGDISIRPSKHVVPLPDHIASFPGPLRSKSKKKDVLAWLTASIARLEAQSSQLLPDPRRRHEERILLVKILRSLVEHDGTLDTGPGPIKSINAILAPEIHAVDEATATQYKSDDMLAGIYRPSGIHAKSDAVDPMGLEVLRKHLLRGNRQDAVWHAVDSRLWSHALIIASTLSPDVWRQVVQEFVKQEVKPVGANTESMSALYEIFAGNMTDATDQLVPPSARAGLQMLSRVDQQSGPTKNTLDGLDRWRETLTLVVNNRTQGDQQALASLGRLLAEYARTDAAHICFLFSRSPTNPTVLGGPDDPHTSLTLLGADRQRQFLLDHESLLLTEVYEFATLVLGGHSTMPFLPYLSPYKLQRAVLLTEAGFKVEAQAYCDALAASVNKSTKTLPYYNRVFLGELEDFQNRLKEIPVHPAGSWAKPNLEKVSSSLLGKFSSFVAGDDSDAESKGSNKEDAGPLAKLSATPSLSRTGSQSDIYSSSYPSASMTGMPSTIAGSRYAPNGIGSPKSSSSDVPPGRPSLDSQRSPPQSSYGPSPYEPVNMLQPAQFPPASNPYELSAAAPPTAPYSATRTSYTPNAPAISQSLPYTPNAPAVPPQSSPYTPNAPAIPPQSSSFPSAPLVQQSYIPTPPPEPQQSAYQPQPSDLSRSSQIPEAAEVVPSFSGFVSAQPDEAKPFLPQHPSTEPVPSFSGFVSAQQDQTKPFLPQQPPPTEPSGYEPLSQPQSYGGYEPPSDTGYVPYVPEPDSPDEPKPKKKSFMDDDADDFAPPPSNPTPTSGWFGGLWSGGKKDGSLDGGASASANQGGAEPKVYRANLGESKMKIYYDKDLKKWINPDNPDSATKAAAATPPPPRAPSAMGAPPPRASSAMGPPPLMRASPSATGPTPAADLSPMTSSNPPSRQGTPASGATPVLSSGAAATLPVSIQASLGVSSSAPPSRPGTAASNVSSIDDLLGPGPPAGGRKSVRAKKGAKAGRYVDVMAK